MPKYFTAIHPHGPHAALRRARDNIRKYRARAALIAEYNREMRRYAKNTKHKPAARQRDETAGDGQEVVQGADDQRD